MKTIESLAHKENGDYIVRFFMTRPLIDKKWTMGLEVVKDFLIVKYPKNKDKFLATWNINNEGKKVQWWDYETHEEIKAAIEGYENFPEEARANKDLAKAEKARELLNECIIERFVTNSFEEAQDIFCQWAGIENMMMGK